MEELLSHITRGYLYREGSQCGHFIICPAEKRHIKICRIVKSHAKDSVLIVLIGAQEM